MWPDALDVEGFFVACFRKGRGRGPWGPPGPCAQAAQLVEPLQREEVMRLQRLLETTWNFWPGDEERWVEMDDEDEEIEDDEDEERWMMRMVKMMRRMLRRDG